MIIKDIEFWTKTLLDNGANVKIISKAIGKMEAGIHKYGEFNPKTDTRNFVEELLKELYDGVNYCLLGMLKEPDKKTDLESLLANLVNTIHLIEQTLR